MLDLLGLTVLPELFEAEYVVFKGSVEENRSKLLLETTYVAAVEQSRSGIFAILAEKDKLDYPQSAQLIMSEISSETRRRTLVLFLFFFLPLVFLLLALSSFVVLLFIAFAVLSFVNVDCSGLG